MKTERRTRSTNGPTVILAALTSAGVSMALTAMMLSVFRFASIEDRTGGLGEELYLELPPALPSERAFLLAVLAMAAVCSVFLLLTVLRRRKS